MSDPRYDARHIATRSLVGFVKAMREANEYLSNARAYELVFSPAYDGERWAHAPRYSPEHHAHLLACANNRVTLAWACWWQREDLLAGRIEGWSRP